MNGVAPTPRLASSRRPHEYARRRHSRFRLLRRGGHDVVGGAGGLRTPATGHRARPEGARVGLPPAAQPHAAAPPHRPDRARDPRGRAARRLGRGVRGGREARPQPHVPGGHRLDRERVGEARPAARHAPDDARAERGGSRREARRVRPDRREPDAAGGGPERARADGRSERRCGRGAPLPRERPAGAAGGVQGGCGRDGRERRGRAAPRPDAAPARERHHLVGLVPGARPGRPLRRGDRRAWTSLPPSSSPPTTSSARARSPRSGSGSRARRRAARRPASTAAGSRT